MNDYDREAVMSIKEAIWEYHDDLDLGEDVQSLIEALHEMVADFLIEEASEVDE